MLNTSESIRDLTLLRLRLLLQRQGPGCQRGPAVSVAGAARVLEKWHSPVRAKRRMYGNHQIVQFVRVSRGGLGHLGGGRQEEGEATLQGFF